MPAAPPAGIPSPAPTPNPTPPSAGTPSPAPVAAPPAGGATAPSTPAATAPAAIRPEFYYALFRAGLPANAETLYRASPQSVQAIWQQAIAQGVIPASLQSQIPAALATYQTLSATNALTAKSIVGVSPLKDVLQVSLTDPKQQQQFAQLYVQHQGDTAGFWTAVQTAFGADVAKKLQLDGQLSYLTLDNGPLLTALHNAEQKAPLTSSLDLASRGYYDPAKWQPLIGTSIPIQIPGATAAAQSTTTLPCWQRTCGLRSQPRSSPIWCDSPNYRSRGPPTSRLASPPF